WERELRSDRHAQRESAGSDDANDRDQGQPYPTQVQRYGHQSCPADFAETSDARVRPTRRPRGPDLSTAAWARGASLGCERGRDEYANAEGRAGEASDKYLGDHAR